LFTFLSSPKNGDKLEKSFIIGYWHQSTSRAGHLAANLNALRQEVNMTKTKKMLALMVILTVTVLSTVSLYSVEKPAAANGNKLVNINTADAGQLENLPRVGPKMAQRILDFRKSNGNFKRAQDLMKVKGIGEKVFAKLQPLITI
jgi:competence protein ComEA